MYEHSRTFTLLLCAYICIKSTNICRLKSPNSMSSITHIEQSNNIHNSKSSTEKQRKKSSLSRRASAAHMCSILHTYVRIYTHSHNVLLTLLLLNDCLTRTNALPYTHTHSHSRAPVTWQHMYKTHNDMTEKEDRSVYTSSPCTHSATSHTHTHSYISLWAHVFLCLVSVGRSVGWLVVRLVCVLF